MSAINILSSTGRARVRRLCERSARRSTPGARTKVPLVKFARFDTLDERGPLVGRERQRRDLRVLAVTDKDGIRGLRDLDTGIGAAVAALLPLRHGVDLHLESLTFRVGGAIEW